jgi:cellulose synthase/poly-beta-1,6-N-acetylglucosamine synthase-like glycosyltransferase
MTAPRVSVIIPFLNASTYFAEAIESVITQSFPDWELVLVDDGSTDASPSIARRYGGKDSRIVVVPHDPLHRGAAVARNRGIAAARGPLIAFLDADDLYMPEKLACDIAALEADPKAAWVYGATRWFYQDGQKRDYIERLGVALDRRYEPPAILARIILDERGDIPCTCAVMIRKEALEAVGGFEERFALYEDQSLWVKLLLTYPVRILSGCHAAYRQHADSTSTAATATGDYDRNSPHPARDAFLQWVGEYADAHHAPASVNRALATALTANDGRLVTRMARKLRRMNRYLY